MVTDVNPMSPIRFFFQFRDFVCVRLAEYQKMEPCKGLFDFSEKHLKFSILGSVE